MTDWSHGYDVSVGYTYGFCPEMAPDWLDLCARIAGGASPRSTPSVPFRFLELGMGQGMGLCLLAAANPQGDFLGIDFQPEHVAHAQALADAAGLSNIRFRQADFVQLAEDWPEDFGTFDYVALHGVYSWVSPAVRQAVVQCLGHATQEGSLVYNGFNTQPGWLATMPFQHISRLIKETSGLSGGPVFDASLALFDRLKAGGADSFKILPGLTSRLEAVRTRKANYLVHEYLHESWHPLWHSEVRRELAEVQLDYIGTATVAETLLPAVLPPPLREAILEQTDDALRQDVQDFVINQFFRRDLYRRGSHAAAAGSDDASDLIVHLVQPPDPASNLEIKAAFGEITLQPPAFAEIVGALRNGPMSIDEIAALPGMRRQGRAGARHIVHLLLHARTLAVRAGRGGMTEQAHRLNAMIARGAADGLPYDHIAAFHLGSAIPVTDVDLLLLDCWLTTSGRADAAKLAEGVTDRLAKLGRTLQHEGASLHGAQAERLLKTLAKAFLEDSLPRWRRLGAVS